MSRNLFPIVLVIFLFNYQACQDFDEDTMKALGCLSLIRKLDNDKQQDQRMVSAILLSCFVNVEESQVKKLISSQYSNKMELSKSEVDKLVDMQSLQSKYFIQFFFLSFYCFYCFYCFYLIIFSVL